MEQVSYIHVDSRSRDTTLYPGANVYTVFLNKPITNITRVDLVSAQVVNPFTTNCYIWLDVTELRTPLTYDARKLQLTNTLGLSTPIAGISTFGTFSATVIGTTTATYANVPAIIDKGARFTVARVSGTVTSVTMTSSGNTYTVGEIVTLAGASVGGATPTDNITFPVTALVPASVQRSQTSSTTSATSFAMIPVDVPQNFNRVFKETSDYQISIKYPSRLDSIERLTIRWLDYTGAVVQFTPGATAVPSTQDQNSFVLRVYTTFPPVVPDRQLGLPPPVKDGLFEDRDKMYMGAVAFLVIGLVMILLTRRR